jgi:GTP-binding protein
VPVGTVVSLKEETQGVLADLDEPGKWVVVVHGGKGGRGNSHFASSTNQAPELAEKGTPGEERSLILELKVIADIGIIGYPNVGKSTLLAAISAARPKVAAYPFTTLEPVLGTVEIDGESVVFAEIPGLVAGAHLGRGLGHDFLRHIARTRVLLHLIDGGSASPADDMVQVNNELALFDSALAAKPQLVVVNKIDLSQVRARREGIQEIFQGAGITPIFVSAATGEGIASVLAEAGRLLAAIKPPEAAVAEPAPVKVFRPGPRHGRVSVHKEGDAYIVESAEIAKVLARVDVSRPGVRPQVLQELSRLGLNQALKAAGAGPGARVRCGELEWFWYP